MPDNCVPQLQTCRLRFGRLAAGGAPAVGANNILVTKSFTTLATTAVYTDGDEIEDKNACGEVESQFRSADTFKRLDFSITFLVPDPYITAGLTDGVVLTAGTAIGAGYPALGPVDETNIWSIEAWAKRVKNGALDPDYPYAHWAFPQAQNIRIGDKEMANGTHLTVISGQLVENPNWGDGPANDFPVASTRVAQWIPDDALPAVACGFITSIAS